MDGSLHRQIRLSRQFGGLAGGYSAAEDWENQEWTHNTLFQPVAIGSWLRGLNLLTSALSSFPPSQRYDSGETEDNDAHKAFWLSYTLLTLAGRAAKPALDLILASYYIEAWALERTMLEGWIRAVYIRVLKAHQPEVWRRWQEPYREVRTGPPPLREPGWGEAAAVIRECGNLEDKAVLDEAQLRWSYLNLGAHPSSQGVEHVYDDELQLVKFYPEFDENLGTHALCHGVFIQLLLLREIKELTDFPEGWLEDLGEFSALADALELQMRPELERHARALRAERDAAKDQKRSRRCRPSNSSGA
jgi:hypothetical protein